MRPSPALAVAFIALFAAIGGIGYSAVKLKPNSIRTKNIRDAAVTRNKLADGAVSTPKLAPDAVAPNATHAASAMDAARLGGVPPGGCQAGWIKASVVIHTSGLTDQPGSVSGVDCASKADDAIQVSRAGTGVYEITIAGIDSADAIASSSLANVVTAATEVKEGGLVVHVWSNPTGDLVDGTTFTLIVF